MKDRFLRDVKDHQLDVLQDNGVFRCLRLGRPKSSSYYFMLTTWPGHLCISGDMDCYVFSRTNDMFEFFRNEKFEINFAYWTEKLRAVCKNGGGPEDFDGQATLDFILEGLKESETELDEYQKSDLQNLKSCRSAGEAYHILQQIEEVQHLALYECMRHKPSFHAEWCLYAIVWGIQQYDLAQKEKAHAA